MVQALFLTEMVLTEIKAGNYRNPNFILGIPLGRAFRITCETAKDGFHGDVPEFLRNIHGQGKPIDPQSPFYNAFQIFWITVDTEILGQKLFQVNVNTTWNEGKAERHIRLAGLIEILPNEFNEELE